ncbi:MAG: tetratricopeptide repeat protein [Bacteroidia bacterium]|nr:tetratricopeptide repeat protein [Bacteroidia bacterium]
MIFRIFIKFIVNIFISYFYILLFPLPCFAQKQNTIDSLLNIISKTKQDTVKIITLGILSDNYRGNYPEKAIQYATQGMNLAEKINYKKGFSICCNKIGIIHKEQCRYDQAERFCFSALQAAQELSDSPEIATARLGKKLIAIIFNNIGEIYRIQGIYDKAITFYLKSVKNREEISDKDGISECYNNIGSVQIAQGNFIKAVEYFQKSLEICEEIHNMKGIATCYNNLGIVCAQQNELDKAAEYFLQSLKINETTFNKNGIAECCNNLGLIHEMKKNFNKAIEYYSKSLKIAEEQGDKNIVSRILGNISLIKINLKKYNEAIELAQKSLQIALEIGSLDNQSNSYSILAEANDSLGYTKESYKNYKLFIAIQDSMFNIAKHKQLSEMESKYQNEKKKKEIELLNKNKALQQTEIKQQRTQKYAFIGGFILMLLLAVVILRSYREKRKANILLESQKKEIEKQKEYIEYIHEDLTDSIRYAERIQNAVLPREQYIRELLLPTAAASCHAERSAAQSLPKCRSMDYFILFRPRDIVSGDFYFVEKRKNWLLITVADCTGHGVPGAFMSMLGISFLNEIIAKEEIQSANHVLDELRRYVIHSLQQKGVEGEQQDGMDIAFIALNCSPLEKGVGGFDTYELQYAGANNPLYIVTGHSSIVTGKNKQFETNDQCLMTNDLLEIKADKMPVGIYQEMHPFKNNIIEVNKGDRLYIFSDGFIDQFGGENRKKFLPRRLKQTLLQICDLTMTEQKEKLNTIFEEWKGNSEQIDDVTVIGFKI